MIRKKWELDRRFFLKAAGVGIALPFLDAMVPSVARASATKTQRFMLVYLPNGHIAPDATGSYCADTMTVLNTMREDLTMISKLTTYTDDEGHADHIQAPSSFVMGYKTGLPVFGTTTFNFDAPFNMAAMKRSMDQRIADVNKGSMANVINYHAENSAIDEHWKLSWEAPSTPAQVYASPAALFNKLFGGTSTTPPPTTSYPNQTGRLSILHYVNDQITATKKIVGKDDLIRLDEYFTAVSELEKKVAATTTTTTNTCEKPNLATNAVDAESRINLFYDMAAIAYQCDLTRVLTCTHALDGTEMPQDFVPGLSNASKGQGWHAISHGLGAAGFADIYKIEAWHVNKIVQFAQKLKSIKLPNGNTLLSESTIAFGHGMDSLSPSGGTQHNYHAMRVSLLGGANGAIKTNVDINAGGANISNLWLTLMQAYGVDATSFAESSGIISGLKI